MKKFALVMLGLTAALPLYAQDSGTTPPPDASSTPPADDQSQQQPSDASTTPPADGTAAPATTEAAPSEPAPATTTEAAPATTEPAPATTDASPTTTTEAAPATSEAAPATETAAPAEATPAEASPTEAAPAEATATESTPTESTPTDTAATVETPAEGSTETAAADTSEHKPWIFYGGADYGSVKVSISDEAGFPGADFSNRIWQGRLGMRLNDAIGAEFHFAKGIEDKETPNQPMLDMSYGVYIVPTGTLLDVVEFGFPLGFAWAKLKAGDTTATEDGISYGMNVEFPFKLVWDALPDVRLGGGGMVYQQNNSTRTYGWHVGLRFDFAI